MIGNIGDGQSELVIRACIAENTFARLQNMKILHRNVKQCNDHALSGGNPRFAIDFFLTAKVNLVIGNVLLNRKPQRLSIQLRMI